MAPKYELALQKVIKSHLKESKDVSNDNKNDLIDNDTKLDHYHLQSKFYKCRYNVFHFI